MSDGVTKDVGESCREHSSGGWTVSSYAAHNEALRTAEEKFQEERDRRYAEVNTEKEKALKIKETADLAALQLAREIQTYKDEKANELRSQIESERGTYVTQGDLKAVVEKLDVTIKPLVDYVSAQSGPRALTGTSIAAFVASIVLLLGFFFTVYNNSKTHNTNPIINVKPTIVVPKSAVTP
jgi:hypothetical protein